LKERIMSNWLTTAVVSLVTLATFATSPAVADQRYELRPRFTVGQRWSEQRTNTFEMSTTVKDDTQIYDRNEQSTRAVLELEWEVLAIDHGIPTAARVKFGPGCETQIQQNGASQTIRHAAAGTVVTARLLPDGEVQYDPATANHPDVEATFAELFEINPALSHVSRSQSASRGTGIRQRSLMHSVVEPKIRARSVARSSRSPSIMGERSARLSSRSISKKARRRKAAASGSPR
jgi:hypothetical protein